MKILVTGANGQVGQALAIAADDKDLDVVLAAREDLDITDLKAVISFTDGCRPDVIVNAAAYTAVDRAEKDVDLAYAINHKGAENLAIAVSKLDIPLLHISTDFIFDGSKEEAYLETDSCGPISVYGASKRAGEEAIYNKCVKHIILRTAWVFGGPVSFVKTMRRLAENRTELSVVADQFGGPTPAIDIANSLLTMAGAAVDSDFDNWGIYHYCGTPKVSWHEFAVEILKDVKGVTVNPIPTSGYPTPAKRPANSVLDCTKIQDVFGISQPNWKSYLKEEGQ